jgi:hypothetical protein
MEKIVEALSKLLPTENVSEVAEAVQSELQEAKENLEAEYSQKLEEAYLQFSEELKSAEQTGEQGYQEAFAIINDLRGRLDAQRSEFDSAMHEGYEEAYQMLQKEKSKNDSVEVEMYEEFNGKLQEMREYFIDKIHQFLEFKGPQIAESVRRDVLNDPRLVDHKVTLDKVVQNVSDYLSEENYNGVCNSKLEEAHGMVEDLRSQVKILEARNIRLNTENGKLNENVRQAHTLLTESTSDRKAREEKAKKATGRGRAVTDTEIVVEHTGEPVVEAQRVGSDTSLVESLDPEYLEQMRVLSGTSTKK